MTTKHQHSEMASAIEALLRAADQYVNAKLMTRQVIDRKVARTRSDLRRRRERREVCDVR